MAAALGGTLVLLAALALAPGAAIADELELEVADINNNDPIEPVNRALFEVNQFADHNLMRPVAQAYRDLLPRPVQSHIHNFLSNLSEPAIGLNDVLQGNPGRFWTTLRRFVVNTTLGGVGVFDVATDWGMPHHDADFGQTLGVWGVEQGPYIVLPLFGPSSVRDAVGTALGFAADPFLYASPGTAALTYVDGGIGVGNVLDKRASALDALDALELTSVDYYATLRSAYSQYREAIVTEGRRPPNAGEVEVEMPKLEKPLPGEVPASGSD